MTMDPLYQEQILDHYKHPRNKGYLEDADVREKGHNASCGDTLTLHLKWEGERLANVMFEGLGCAISQSGASMLTEYVKGKSRAEISALSSAIMTELYGVEVGPQREKCAMLAYGTLRSALENDAKTAP